MGVRITDLSFRLGDFSFGPKTFEFEDRGLYLIRGKNGCGKTSFLRCLLGRIRKQSGEILGLKFPVATCGVEALFFGSWTVRENYDWLASLGGFNSPSTALSNRRFDRMSKGQQRQAELDFVLQIDTETLFLDEPFTHLDHEHLQMAALQIQAASASRLILITSHQEVEGLKFNRIFEL